MRMKHLLAAVAASALCAGAAQAQVSVKLGVLNDMSGLYADISGPGSVVAAQMAIDDFKGGDKGVKAEIVSADHQNKPDNGSAIARKWYDQAVEWMDKNQPTNKELRRFRSEAAELLGVKEKKE